MGLSLQVICYENCFIFIGLLYSAHTLLKKNWNVSVRQEQLDQCMMISCIKIKVKMTGSLLISMPGWLSDMTSSCSSKRVQFNYSLRLYFMHFSSKILHRNFFSDESSRSIVICQCTTKFLLLPTDLLLPQKPHHMWSCLCMPVNTSCVVSLLIVKSGYT